MDEDTELPAVGDRISFCAGEGGFRLVFLFFPVLCCTLSLADEEPAPLEVDRLLDQAESRQNDGQAEFRERLREAREMALRGDLEGATSHLVRLPSAFPATRTGRELAAEVAEFRRELFLSRARNAVESNRLTEAQTLLDAYRQAGGRDTMAATLEGEIGRRQLLAASAFPDHRLLPEASRIEVLLQEAHSLLEAGNVAAAHRTVEEALRINPHHLSARRLHGELSRFLGESEMHGREATRNEMIQEVREYWVRPRVFDDAVREVAAPHPGSRILRKLAEIVIPRVTFSGPLSRVVDTLSELSVQYDRHEPVQDLRGVNIVLIDPGGHDPVVNISLRNLSLGRVLEFVTKQVNYQYDVADDAVVVSRGDASGGNVGLVTEFFPVSRATVIRLTGFRDLQASPPGPVDPFAAPASPAGPPVNEEEEALKGFFERAGVPFSSVSGATLAFDGTQLIVTQTPRNIERLRTILRRYNRTKQVEIEARFLEVQQGDLEEIGFQWGYLRGGRPVLDPETGLPERDATGREIRRYDTRMETANRTLNSAFSVDRDESSVTITGPASESRAFPVIPPLVPNAVDLAADVAANLFHRTAIFDTEQIDLVIRALSRRSGTDLLSSPRLTVLSGKTARIVVAQELLYPERYGDIQLPSPGGSRDGTVSTIAIASATPHDFVRRNIGVEMEVTPTVEDNDDISLLLEPRVTEFDGFMEYGGPSVAIGGDGTVVTVPSGFFQPMFSTRSVRTEVTIYDGATVVIGGLVREEVKMITDKVPILGDIPLVGRLFRSTAETSQKRNLMIFVTANLVSPGGSFSRQRLETVEPNSLFQYPGSMTPGGFEKREDRQAEP